MASEVTLYSNDGDWKIFVEAWKNNFIFYSSIGTEVTVYRREQTSNIWGNSVTGWVRRPAESIYIQNVYAGTSAGSVTRQKTCNNASYCELKEWAVGFSVSIPSGDIIPTSIN